MLQHEKSKFRFGLLSSTESVGFTVKLFGRITHNSVDLLEVTGYCQLCIVTNIVTLLESIHCNIRVLRWTSVTVLCCSTVQTQDYRLDIWSLAWLGSSDLDHLTILTGAFSNETAGMLRRRRLRRLILKLNYVQFKICHKMNNLYPSHGFHERNSTRNTLTQTLSPKDFEHPVAKFQPEVPWWNIHRVPENHLRYSDWERCLMVQKWWAFDLEIFEEYLSKSFGSDSGFLRDFSKLVPV